ncbi:MAG TPA: MBL fold metallo-hydrolase RNA specificity domain-containing protein [Candidatus Dormibacteraeota bacterium]|nr:MBL fold metallo-hydrolase RNA specificity domain-containing protein [Candidatus Dormibacteraeota bacterium]
MTREVVWDHGVSLPGHRLWLDPLVVRTFAFISHAHTDHARRHKEALLTPQTLALIPESRRPRGWRMLGYREPMRRGQATVTLLPAGHMLGSAQLLFEHQGTTLLYTGDIKLRQAGGAPPTFIPKADVLIIETTYGRPHFRFGDPDSTIEAIAMWCRRALDSRVTPVLLCHALGKTEEVMLALAPYGFSFALEKRCAPCAREYATAGRPLPDWVELDGDAPDGRVVIAPPAGKDEVRRLGRYRTALISGWAKDAEFARIFGADATFDLSDHCDFDELIDVVERSGADQVYTVHGYTEDFARHLRRRGIRASALEATEQLALAL